MSRMSEQDLAHLHESFVAEAAGDAERALAHHEAVRPFPDNSHRVMLRQLVELGDAVPSWGHARWILEQVTRWITGDTVAATAWLARARSGRRTPSTSIRDGRTGSGWRSSAG